MKSICVIGGGLIGAASALRLQDAGLQTTLIDPGDKRRAASYGNAGHIGSEQVSPWSSWDNVLRAPRSSFALGGPLDFRWRDAPLWGPWALQFLAACGTDRFAAGRAALTALLTDTMGAWTRLAHLAGRPDLVIPHGHVTAWMTPAGADAGRQAFACTAWGSAAYRDMTDAELTRYEAVLRRKPHAAVLFSNTGQVSDPQAARDAILSKFVALGGETCIGKATRRRQRTSDLGQRRGARRGRC
ncbi:MAG: FAD-dependent oxidoreductase [Hyphomonadaceae bacterium]